MTSEGFLEWSLWRHNVSVYREASWMFCKFSDATNKVAKYITTKPQLEPLPNPNPNPNQPDRAHLRAPLSEAATVRNPAMFGQWRGLRLSYDQTGSVVRWSVCGCLELIAP